jgi:5-methylcytosine-specific restriction endonuclease McrA
MVTMLRTGPKMAGDRLKQAPRADSTQRIRGSALQAIRHRILTRDAGQCRCTECKTTWRILPAHEVDHRVPLWAGGQETDANRYAINRDCHKAKTAREAAARARGDTPGASA